MSPQFQNVYKQRLMCYYLYIQAVCNEECCLLLFQKDGKEICEVEPFCKHHFGGVLTSGSSVLWREGVGAEKGVGQQREDELPA